MSNILIIEDDATVRENLEELLKFKGYTVFSSADGKEGLDMAFKKEPDLIISDIMMPEMDGYEAMQYIRNQTRWQNIPMVALTAKAMSDDKQKCIDAGANDYLAKPINLEKLLDVARVWVDR